MIPAIGYMVGFYIFTRCLEILGNKESEGATKVFAIITILVTIFNLFSLFAGSATMSTNP